MADNTSDLRREFAETVLPGAVLIDPTAFYDAFTEGEDAVAAYLTALWDARQAVAESPFFPEVAAYVLEDSDEGFCAVVTATLPETAAASETVSAVVLGSDMDPRVFAALPETLPGGETLALCEIKPDGSRPVGTLYQGCDNDLQLFDPPTPQPVDRRKPLSSDRRAAAIVDSIVRWCLQND